MSDQNWFQFKSDFYENISLCAIKVQSRLEETVKLDTV